jgi:probable F420-dependent oxidoreductase
MSANGRTSRVYVRPHGWVGKDARGAPARAIAWAQEAEQLGFHGIFLGDRMLAEAEGAAGGSVYAASMLEVTTLLAAIAASTERIEIGTLIYVFPYRHPVQIAKTTATLDAIADGRLILGVGIGWNRKEFDVLGIQTRGRGDVFEEALGLVRALWSGDPVSHDGATWQFQDVQVTPRPVRAGGPPVWIASFSPDDALNWADGLPETLRNALTRVGRIGDGWVPLIYSASSKRRVAADVLGSAWEFILKAAAEVGRSREQIEFVYADWCYVLDEPYGSRHACEAALSAFFEGDWADATATYTIGTSGQVLEQIAAHTKHVDHVDAYVLTPLEDSSRQLRALAEKIRPHLSGLGTA